MHANQKASDLLLRNLLFWTMIPTGRSKVIVTVLCLLDVFLELHAARNKRNKLWRLFIHYLLLNLTLPFGFQGSSELSLSISLFLCLIFLLLWL